MSDDKEKDQGPVPGGGPREGEEAQAPPNPNPAGVHPDYPPAVPEAGQAPMSAQPADEADRPVDVDTDESDK